MHRASLRRAARRLRGVECELVTRNGRAHFQALVNGTAVSDLPGRQYGGTQAALYDVLTRLEGYHAQAAVPQDLTIAAMSMRPTPPFILTDDEFSALAVAHVCGSPLLPTTDAVVGRALCPLCGKVDEGTHMERCGKLQGARTKPHHVMVKAVQQCVSQVPGMLTIVEPCREAYEELGLARPDILAVRAGAAAAVIDLVVTARTQAPVALLRQEELRKHHVYSRQTWFPPLRRGTPLMVLPMAFTTRGYVGEEASTWLRARAREVDQRSGRKCGLSTWSQWRFEMAKALGLGLCEEAAYWARLASRRGVFAWAPGARSRV